MSDVPRALPGANLLLKPCYDDAAKLQRIVAKLCLTNNNITKNGTVFYRGHIKHGRQPCVLDPSRVRFTDSQGDLVKIRGDASEEYHEVERDSTGTIILDFQVAVSELELLPFYHKQEGGVILVGNWFLPNVVTAKAIQEVSISWDLQGSPSGMRAVCSIGEGPELVSKAGGLELLLDSVFAIGHLQSYPKGPGTTSDAGVSKHPCATYWLDTLPKNLADVTSYTHNIFPRVSDFFKDTNGTYRLFLRRVPRGFTGLTCHASSIIDYDALTENKHNYDLVRLLNRYMVASWAQLDAEEDGTGNEWFCLGLSQLYSIFFPFRFKQRGPDYFRETINCFLSAYYTNPLASVPWDDVAEKVDSTWHAKSAMLMRSCIYMLKMDSYTRRSSRERGAGILRPIDEIVGDIVERRRKGETLRESDWLEYLGRWLGQDEAKKHFQNFLGGKIMELDDMSNSFGDKDGPVPVEQEMLNMGFDIDSLDYGIVKGLVKGSRAEAAGLRDGDVIIRFDEPETCELHFDSRFKMTINRNGDDLDIEFWPRMNETVRSWQVKRLVIP